MTEKNAGFLSSIAEKLTTPIPGTPELFSHAASDATRYGKMTGQGAAKVLAPAEKDWRAGRRAAARPMKTASDVMYTAFLDELEKIGGTPPPLPAAALKAVGNAVKKPKLYGEEGFQALMHGAQAAKSNPFATMKMGSIAQRVKAAMDASLMNKLKATAGSGAALRLKRGGEQFSARGINAEAAGLARSKAVKPLETAADPFK